MAKFRILSAEKKANETADSVSTLLAAAYPDWRVENVVEVDGEWQARLVQDKISSSQREVVAGDPPPFLKKKDDKEDSSDDDSDDDSGDDDPDDDGIPDKDDPADDSDSDDDSHGDKGGDGKNPAKEVQKVIDELTNLLADLGGKAQDLQKSHDEKDEKLKDIAETAGGGLGDAPVGPPPGGAMGPDEIGPTPGGPPPGGGSKIPLIPKRPGVPTGDAPIPGGPSAFSNRRTEIASHSGVDDRGNRISLVAAAAQLERDPAFAAYKVVDIKEENGQYIAKLQVR